MTDPRPSSDAQDEIVNDMATRLGALDDGEIDEALEKLDAEHALELRAALRDYANSAIGDDHWDSDEQG